MHDQSLGGYVRRYADQGGNTQRLSGSQGFTSSSAGSGGRNGAPAAKPAGTKGSVVDHMGFEVKDYDAFKAKAMAARCRGRKSPPERRLF